MPKPRTPKQVEDRIQKLYEEGLGAVDVAKETRVAATTVYRVLQRLGIPIRQERRHERYRLVPRERHGLVVSAYSRGVPASKIAEQEGCSISVIRRVLKETGTPSFPRGKAALHRNPATVKRVVGLYATGMSQQDIASDMRVSQTAISGVLRYAGVQKRTRSAEQMREGRSITGSGYSLVKLPIGDPMMPMALASGYVSEHRLTMAKHLGRLLRDDETVHHIDGNRTNNALSNLQIRHGQHGAGVVLVCGQCGSVDLVHAPLRET